MAITSGIPLLGDVLGMVNDWFKGKREEQKAKLEADISFARRRQEADISWDQIMAHGSQSSWKDEFWTIVLAIPAVLAFLPFSQPWVLAGFEALIDTPLWYQTMLGTAIAAAFGREQVIHSIRDWTRTRREAAPTEQRVDPPQSRD